MFTTQFRFSISSNSLKRFAQINPKELLFLIPSDLQSDSQTFIFPSSQNRSKTLWTRRMYVYVYICYNIKRDYSNRPPHRMVLYVLQYILAYFAATPFKK